LASNYVVPTTGKLIITAEGAGHLSRRPVEGVWHDLSPSAAPVHDFAGDGAGDVQLTGREAGRSAIDLRAGDRQRLGRDIRRQGDDRRQRVVAEAVAVKDSPVAETARWLPTFFLAERAGRGPGQTDRVDRVVLAVPAIAEPTASLFRVGVPVTVASVFPS